MSVLFLIFGCASPPAAFDVRLDGVWHGPERTLRLPTIQPMPSAASTRTITVPTEWSGGVADLEFAATGWRVRVSLDGREVGQGTGGLWPARIRLSDRLPAGRHTLSFTVDPPAPDNIIPGSTLQPVSGWVWGMPREGNRLGHGAITLRIGPGRRIERVEARLIEGGATVEASAWTVGVAVGTPVQLALVRDGATALTLTAMVDADGMARTTAPWTGPRWPDPEGLYWVTADAGEGARRQLRIGLRSSEQRADGLYINGARTYIAASRLTPVDVSTRAALARSAKLLADEGANAVELHGEVIPSTLFEGADELGLPIVLTPRCDGLRMQGGQASQVPQSAAHDAFVNAGDVLARDFLRPHPSLILWTIEAPPRGSKHLRDPLYDVDGLPVIDENENSNFADPSMPPQGIPRGPTAFYGELPWVPNDRPGFSYAERLAPVLQAHVATGVGLVLPALKQARDLPAERASILQVIRDAGVTPLGIDAERRGASTLVVHVVSDGKPFEGGAVQLELPGQFPVGAISDAEGTAVFEVDYSGDTTVRLVGGESTPVHLTPGVWKPGEWVPNPLVIELAVP